MFEKCDLLSIPLFLLGEEQIGKQGSIIEDNTIGNETTALIPDLLLGFGFES